MAEHGEHHKKHSQHHQEVYNPNPVSAEHKSNWTHELVGGAAAFEAMKLYEDKMKRDGKPDNHALAKEILAGIAGAAADGLFETKGLDFIDKQKAKHHAKEQAEILYEERYGKGV
ncbi:hypothetical protein BC936DRAFT_141560 [Jimgerdemannia flammicorona]|uniref:CipC-like antibiotic response protein n=1 Tax=Jimgerdemannia flammicorona TaxID=994334 RepID=A0A433DG02_9FUNG|nr:hypothetical protein BC936DRAFT_141560 [Jimgerdemannia flammicorona]